MGGAIGARAPLCAALVSWSSGVVHLSTFRRVWTPVTRAGAQSGGNEREVGSCTFKAAKQLCKVRQQRPDAFYCHRSSGQRYYPPMIRLQHWHLGMDANEIRFATHHQQVASAVRHLLATLYHLIPCGIISLLDVHRLICEIWTYVTFSLV